MFVRIASKSELPAFNQAKQFTIANRVVCVANVEGRLAAMDDVCLHRGGSLGQGLVMDGKIICPWHAWRWDPVSGASVEDPELKTRIYPIRIEGDDVLVDV